jgi:RNA polymerase sigma-70 factor (ECF subfamily)
MSISSTADYFQKIRNGDQQALGEVLDGLRPYVRVIVRSVLHEQKEKLVDESDLIQESLMHASRCCHSFQGQTQVEWLGWLRTITIRTAQRALLIESRRPANEPEIVTLIADRNSTPCNELLRQENADRMAIALTQLPDDMQQVLLWRVIDDLDYQSIGELMHRSPGAMRVLYLRALRRLKEVWQANGSSDSGVLHG